MTAADPSYSRRWLILAVVGVAQVMVVLDTTAVNIALPQAQQALHFSNADRQWVVMAYALTFGSLLPLGGRIGDLFAEGPSPSHAGAATDGAGPPASVRRLSQRPGAPKRQPSRVEEEVAA